MEISLVLTIFDLRCGKYGLFTGLNTTGVAFSASRTLADADALSGIGSVSESLVVRSMGA